MGLRLICVLTVALAAAPAVSAQGKRGPRQQQPPAHLVMERLSRMTMEERNRALAKLPPDRRKAVEQRLEKYNTLPAPMKDRLREEYNTFQQLSPEKQEQVRGLFKQFNDIPEDRRKEVRRELYRLRNMPADRRSRRMASEKYKGEYSDSERQMLDNLVGLLSRDTQPQAGH
jgi:hypothetical protein